MIFEIQNQCLAFLLSLRERLFPARFRQLCRGIWVGFIPMVLSPIGVSRFRRETFRFLLLSNREFYLSKSKKSFQTWIWDPVENGSDYKEMKNKSVVDHLIYRIGYWFFRQRRMVTQGVQKSVSKTSILVNFLPTGTFLMFEMFPPSIYRDGDCNGINTSMIHILLFLCAMSCFSFHFTDSSKASDGKIYYGFVDVTPCGFAVFMKPSPVEFGGGDVIAEAEIPVLWVIIQRRLPNDQIVSLVLWDPEVTSETFAVYISNRVDGVKCTIRWACACIMPNFLIHVMVSISNWYRNPAILKLIPGTMDLFGVMWRFKERMSRRHTYHIRVRWILKKEHIMSYTMIASKAYP